MKKLHFLHPYGKNPDRMPALCVFFRVQLKRIYCTVTAPKPIPDFYAFQKKYFSMEVNFSRFSSTAI